MYATACIKATNIDSIVTMRVHVRVCVSNISDPDVPLKVHHSITISTEFLMIT